MQTQKSIEGIISRSIVDGVKDKKIPTLKQFTENAVISLGYNFAVMKPMESLDKTIPFIPDPYKNEIIRFLGESVISYGYKYLMGEPRVVSQIMLKQALIQGGEMIYKEIK